MQELESLGGWAPYLAQETAQPYFAHLCALVAQAEAEGEVYPPRGQRFAAFRLCPPEAVRCVILGQDPYHGPGQAEGLAFSVPDGVPLPRSLRNIFRERETDLGLPQPKGGSLRRWAEGGVLLLNTVLTVSAHRAGSHTGFGWQRFTDAALSQIRTFPQPVAFVLWGAQAQNAQRLAEPAAGPRLVLCAPHPSPLSSWRGFFGSRPFSQVNAFLRAQGAREIPW